MVRVRLVLCLAGRFFDVAVFLCLRPLRLAEYRAQGDTNFSPRSYRPTRPPVCLRCGTADSYSQLSDLCADRARSKSRRILASLARFAVLALRADVVFMVVADSRFGHRRAAPVCALLGCHAGTRFSGSAGARPIRYFAVLIIASAC